MCYLLEKAPFLSKVLYEYVYMRTSFTTHCALSKLVNLFFCYKFQGQDWKLINVYVLGGLIRSLYKTFPSIKIQLLARGGKKACCSLDRRNPFFFKKNGGKLADNLFKLKHCRYPFSCVLCKTSQATCLPCRAKPSVTHGRMIGPS
jgi:hypothetical protein